jgi:hypothetical protein
MKRTGFRRKTIDELKATQALKQAKRPLGASKLVKVGKVTIKKKKTAKKPNITKLKKDLWQECRRITLDRYPNPKCFTCEREGIEGSNRQLGHFIPSSVCSVEMRYSLDNLRFQCYHCNINLSGNWPAYEKNLTIEKGPDFVNNLKKKNETTKGKQYDILWYQTKLEEYRNL